MTNPTTAVTAGTDSQTPPEGTDPNTWVVMYDVSVTAQYVGAAAPISREEVRSGAKPTAVWLRALADQIDPPPTMRFGQMVLDAQP